MLQLFLISGSIELKLIPLYYFCTWTLAGLFVWSLWRAGKYGVARLHKLYQIPYARFKARNFCLKS